MFCAIKASLLLRSAIPWLDDLAYAWSRCGSIPFQRQAIEFLLLQCCRLFFSRNGFGLVPVLKISASKSIQDFGRLLICKLSSSPRGLQCLFDVTNAWIIRGQL